MNDRKDDNSLNNLLRSSPIQAQNNYPNNDNIKTNVNANNYDLNFNNSNVIGSAANNSQNPLPSYQEELNKVEQATNDSLALNKTNSEGSSSSVSSFTNIPSSENSLQKTLPNQMVETKKENENSSDNSTLEHSNLVENPSQMPLPNDITNMNQNTITDSNTSLNIKNPTVPSNEKGNSLYVNPNKKNDLVSSSKYDPLLDLKMADCYIGDKSDLFHHKKFNFCAFFLNGLYYIYRKRYALGMFLYSVIAFLVVFSNRLFPSNSALISSAIVLLISLLLGLKFNSSYTKRAQEQCKSYIAQNMKAEDEQLMSIARLGGGTNMAMVIFVAIAVSALMPTIEFLTRTSDFGKNDPTNVNILEIVNDEAESVENYFSFDVPDGFIEAAYSMPYSLVYKYDYRDEESKTDSCYFEFQTVSNYEDAKNILKNVINVDRLENVDIETKEINGLKWNHLPEKKNNTYYYTTNYMNKTFFFKFSTTTAATNVCDTYRYLVVSSLAKKEIDNTASNNLSGLTKKIVESNDVISEKMNFQNPASDTKGLYKVSDSSKDIYYYRGNVQNNYVDFADYKWRIMSTNGDTIKLVLESKVDSLKGQFSSTKDKYPFMYYSNSNYQSSISSWYNSKIKPLERYIAESSFCESGKVKFESDVNTGSAQMVLKDEFSPSIKCITDGNGKGVIRSGIGLLTIDDLIYAGFSFNEESSTYLDYIDTTWTMSPAGGDEFFYVWSINKNEEGLKVLMPTSINDSLLSYPVITLKNNIRFSGSGTKDNPYKIG